MTPHDKEAGKRFAIELAGGSHARRLIDFYYLKFAYLLHQHRNEAILPSFCLSKEKPSSTSRIGSSGRITRADCAKCSIAQIEGVSQEMIEPY